MKHSIFIFIWGMLAAFPIGYFVGTLHTYMKIRDLMTKHMKDTDKKLNEEE